MKQLGFVLLNLFCFYSALGQINSPALTPGDTVDLIVSDVTLVDVVNKKIVEKAAIYINQGKIVSLSTIPDVVSRKTIDGNDLVAMPGFINTHTHLWQHVSKSMAPNEKLQDWIRIYQPIHYLTESEIYEVVFAACSEAMLSGITSVSDYASLAFNDYSLNASCKAMKDSEMGGVVIWHNPSIFIPDSIKANEIRKMQETYRENFDIWMGHGPLSFHSIPQVYSAIPIAKRLGLHISEHFMENIQEQRDFHGKVWSYLNQYQNQLTDEDKSLLQTIFSMPVPSQTDWYYLIQQKARTLLDDPIQGQCLTVLEKEKLKVIEGTRTVSPIPLLEQWKVLDNYLAIHAVWPQKEDLKIMKTNHVSISHNPESNMYLSSGMAPTYEYKKNEITTAIGTDGAASNDGINFFSAMKNMWNLNKINLMNASVKDVNEWDILQSATINGAKALMMEDRTGSIDIGKDADMILLDKKTLGLAPYRNTSLPALIIYSGQPSCIDYVISNGKIVAERGELTNRTETSLAHNLSNIALAGDRRNKEGKIWEETYSLDVSAKDRYWFKYRSIRQADQLNLILENKGNRQLRLYFVSAGQRFGGGSPTVIDPAVASRYPEELPKGAFVKQINLASKQSITVKKNKGDFKFTFMFNGKREELVAASGQFLIFASVEKK